jgi:hypothetical protein
VERQSTVIQAEFFHVGGKDTPSLGALFSDIGERVADGLAGALSGSDRGPGIKTTVRFFDSTGELTRFVSHENELEDAQHRLVEAMQHRSGFRAVFDSWNYRRLHRSRMHMRAKVRVRAADAVCRTIAAKEPLAIETWEHRFRLLKRSEAHELVEAISEAKSAWLFVFRQDHLLFDSGKILCCSM